MSKHIQQLKTAFQTNAKQKLTAVIFVLITFSVLIGMFFYVPEIGEEFLTTYRTNVLPGTPVFERLEGAIDAMDTSINAGVPGRPAYIELFGLAQLTMNKKIVPDPNYGALYKTPYGQIAYAVEERWLGFHLDHVYDLVNALKAEQIPFLYIQAPFKLPDAHSQVPLTITDYTNNNADRFLEGLRVAGVSRFDLRPPLAASGMSQNELFYDTDHHWTIDAAFFSTGQIAKKLNADYGFHIDDFYYDINNYNRTTYRDFYIGSLGRRVGRIYGGIDDFSLITPNFETYFSLTQDGRDLPSGSFEDAILVKEYLDERAPLDTNRYAVYHGDNAELVFTNHFVEEGKVLLIKDSFGIPVYSFLALGVHEVRAIDVRLFPEDVAAYAAKYKPDIVILMYNADCFSNQMFNFTEK